jgi:hypothetical protein
MMGKDAHAYNWSNAAKEAGSGMEYSAPLVLFRKDMARSLVGLPSGTFMKKNDTFDTRTCAKKLRCS